MKKFLLAIAVVLCSMPAQAAEWYEGGTMHQASVQQFLQADYTNGLATVADWVGATVGDAHISQLNMAEYKQASNEVLVCVAQATQGVEEWQNQQAGLVALMCMQQLQQKYPWMLTK